MKLKDVNEVMDYKYISELTSALSEETREALRKFEQGQKFQTPIELQRYTEGLKFVMDWILENVYKN